MYSSTFWICVFVALCVILLLMSLLVSVWCTWSDLHDKDFSPDEKRKDRE